MVYLDEDAQHVNFMRSRNQGRTWTEPKIVPGSAIEEGHIGNVSFSADGDNLAVAWEVWTETEDMLIPTLYVQYSYTGGGVENWADEPYVMNYSFYPSVDVEGNTIYVAYLYRPWPISLPLKIIESYYLLPREKAYSSCFPEARI